MEDDAKVSASNEVPRTVARRKFVREVGSVVLGVLIALGIGEIAEYARWQVRAHYTNAAIDAELRRNAGVLDERALFQPCLDRRLEELGRILNAARRDNLLPVIGQIGRPATRPIQTAAWEDAVGSGTLLHLETRRRSGLSTLYPMIAEYPDLLREERQQWATLSILENAQGRISDDMITEASVTVGRLRESSYTNGRAAQQVRDAIVSNVGAPSYILLLDREGTRAEVAAYVRSRPTCEPLSVRIVD
jgi:hypothetical protein